MTGEMAWIKQDGTDSNGEEWGVHAAIARALDGTLRPFDVYQGPYIAIRGARLWLTTDDGVFGQVYNERTDTLSHEFECRDIEAAIEAARTIA